MGEVPRTLHICDVNTVSFPTCDTPRKPCVHSIRSSRKVTLRALEQWAVGSVWTEWRNRKVRGGLHICRLNLGTLTCECCDSFQVSIVRNYSNHPRRQIRECSRYIGHSDRH